MELKQLAPWNWFKKEQEHQARIPVARRNGANGHYPGRAAEIDQLFDELWRSFSSMMPMLPEVPTPSRVQPWLKPSVDIAATDREYAITAELPGVDESQVQVEVVEDTLIIRGRKEHVREQQDAHYYCIERSYGAFQRQLSLPEDADADAITASFKKGVLTVRVPRTSSKGSSVRQIEVKAA